MSDEAWACDSVRCLGVRLAGDLINEMDERGEPIKGDTLLLMLNAHPEPVQFALPLTSGGDVWQRLIDTFESDDRPNVLQGGEMYPLAGRSLALLRAVRPEETGQAITSTQAELLRKDARRAGQAVKDAPLLAD